MARRVGINSYAELEKYLDGRMQFAFDDATAYPSRCNARRDTAFTYIRSHAYDLSVMNMTEDFAGFILASPARIAHVKNRIRDNVGRWEQRAAEFYPDVPEPAEVPPSSRYVDGYRWRDCKSAKDCKRKR